MMLQTGKTYLLFLTYKVSFAASKGERRSPRSMRSYLYAHYLPSFFHWTASSAFLAFRTFIQQPNQV